YATLFRSPGLCESSTRRIPLGRLAGLPRLRSGLQGGGLAALAAHFLLGLFALRLQVVESHRITEQQHQTMIHDVPNVVIGEAVRLESEVCDLLLLARRGVGVSRPLGDCRLQLLRFGGQYLVAL